MAYLIWKTFKGLQIYHVSFNWIKLFKVSASCISLSYNTIFFLSWNCTFSILSYALWCYSNFSIFSELDKLLEDAPLPFIMQHAARISGVRKRVKALNTVLKSIQRRIDNMDRMLSAGIIHGIIFFFCFFDLFFLIFYFSYHGLGEGDATAQTLC